MRVMLLAFHGQVGLVEDDPLLSVLREGARRMLMQAIQAEIDVFVAGHADLVDDHGRKRIVRNGHAPERRIQTGIGPIEVQRPRVRDRGAGDAPPIRFTSAVLPAYLRRTKNVEELLPWLYLKGVSTGQFEEALTVLLEDVIGIAVGFQTWRRLRHAGVDVEVAGLGAHSAGRDAILQDDSATFMTRPMASISAARRCRDIDRQITCSRVNESAPEDDTEDHDEETSHVGSIVLAWLSRLLQQRLA